MSLIHEALQKAETERRAGELPPLLAAGGIRPLKTANRSRRWPWLISVAALVVALGYSNRDLIRDTPVDAVTPKTDVRPKAALSAPPKPATASKPAQVRAQEDIVLPGIPEGVLPKRSELVATPSPDEARPMPPIPEPVALAPEAPQPQAEGSTLPAPASTPVLGEDRVAEVEATPPVVEVPNDPAPEPRESSPTPEPEPVTAPEGIPYLFELPLATRQALPALKVTMQVYHQEPSQRFAIIDGKRVNENGVVGNELNLIEIQRDAMVFEFRGERFLLPRLGR